MNTELSKSQRACAVLGELAPLMAEAKLRTGRFRVKGDGEEYGRAVEVLGRRHGLSSNILKQAARVHRENPQLFERVQAGELTLSAANTLLRGGEIDPRQSQAVRAEQIGALATEGNSVDQIAGLLGISRERVRRIAKIRNVDLPADSVMHGTHKNVDARRIIETTVDGLAGYVIGLQLVNGGALDFDRETAHQMVMSLTHSMGAIAGLRRKLRGIANGNQ